MAKPRLNPEMQILATYFVLLMFSLTVWATPPQFLAVVGDSGSTGAVADPYLAIDALAVGKPLAWFLLGSMVEYNLFFEPFGLKSPGIPQPEWHRYSQPAEFRLSADLKPPRRVFFSDAEIGSKRKDIVNLYMSARGSMRVDLPQYSFGYLVGHGLGLKSQNIVYVGQDGTRSNTILKQIERLFVVPEIKASGHLPEVILISFTANDMCRESNIKKPLDEFLAEYQKIISEQLWGLRRLYKPHPKTTKIIFMAPYNVPNIFQNEQLLDRKITFLGEQITCRDLRNQDPIIFTGLKANALNSIMGMCDSVLHTKLSDRGRLEKITDIFSGIVQVQTKLLAELAAKKDDGFDFIYFRGTYELNLTQSDIANDCFHPALGAHEKVARGLIQILKP